MIKEMLFFCSIAASDHFTSRAVINKGGYELNPVLRGKESKQILFHSGKCVAQSVIMHRVKDKKKRKRIYVIASIIGGGFVVNNVIQMNKGK